LNAISYPPAWFVCNKRNQASFELSTVQFTFPQNKYLPSQRSQLSDSLTISCHIAFKLCCPKTALGFWYCSLAAFFVLVPKAAVYENGFEFGAKDNIRFAWKVFGMQSVAKAKSKKKSSDDHFWSRIPSMDARH